MAVSLTDSKPFGECENDEINSRSRLCDNWDHQWQRRHDGLCGIADHRWWSSYMSRAWRQHGQEALPAASERIYLLRSCYTGHVVSIGPPINLATERKMLKDAQNKIAKYVAYDQHFLLDISHFPHPLDNSPRCQLIVIAHKLLVWY